MKSEKLPARISASAFLGVVFLVAAGIVYIWDPKFSGFFNRGHIDEPIAIWIVLLGIAVLNLIHGFFTYYLFRKVQSNPIENYLSDENHGE